MGPQSGDAHLLSDRDTADMSKDPTTLRSADEIKFYLAGPLFDHAALTGNALLASAIEDVSDERYNVLLPQDIEDPGKRDVDLALIVVGDVFGRKGRQLRLGACGWRQLTAYRTVAYSIGSAYFLVLVMALRGLIVHVPALVPH